MDKLSWYFDEGPVWTVILEQMKWEKIQSLGARCQVSHLPFQLQVTRLLQQTLTLGCSGASAAAYRLCLNSQFKTQQPDQLRQRQGIVKIKPLAGSSPGATHWTALHSKTHFQNTYLAITYASYFPMCKQGLSFTM